jgi:hypothetical protein
MPFESAIKNNIDGGKKEREFEVLVTVLRTVD